MSKQESLHPGISKQDLLNLLDEGYSGPDSLVATLVSRVQKTGDNQQKIEEAVGDLYRELKKIIAKNSEAGGTRVGSLAKELRAAIVRVLLRKRNWKLQRAVKAELEKGAERLHARHGIDMPCFDNAEPSPPSVSIEEVVGEPSPVVILAEPAIDTKAEQNILSGKDENFGEVVQGLVAENLDAFVERGLNNFLIRCFRDFLDIAADYGPRHYSSAQIRSLHRLEEALLAAARSCVSAQAKHRYSSLDDFKESAMDVLDVEMPKYMNAELLGLWQQWFVSLCSTEMEGWDSGKLFDCLQGHQGEPQVLGRGEISRMLMKGKFQAGNDEVWHEEIEFVRARNPRGKTFKGWQERAHAWAGELNNQLHGGQELRGQDIVEKMMRHIRNGRCDGLTVVGVPEPESKTPPPITVTASKHSPPPETSTPAHDKKSEAPTDPNADTPPQRTPEKQLVAVLETDLVELVGAKVCKFPNRELKQSDLPQLREEVVAALTANGQKMEMEPRHFEMLVKLVVEAWIIHDLVHDLSDGSTTLEELVEIVRANAYFGSIIWHWHSLRTLMLEYENNPHAFSVTKHVTARMSQAMPSSPRHVPIHPQVPLVQQKNEVAVLENKETAPNEPATTPPVVLAPIPESLQQDTKPETTESTTDPVPAGSAIDVPVPSIEPILQSPSELKAPALSSRPIDRVTFTEDAVRKLRRALIGNDLLRRAFGEGPLFEALHVLSVNSAEIDEMDAAMKDLYEYLRKALPTEDSVTSLATVRTKLLGAIQAWSVKWQRKKMFADAYGLITQHFIPILTEHIHALTESVHRFSEMTDVYAIKGSVSYHRKYVMEHLHPEKTTNGDTSASSPVVAVKDTQLPFNPPFPATVNAPVADQPVETSEAQLDSIPPEEQTLATNAPLVTDNELPRELPNFSLPVEVPIDISPGGDSQGIIISAQVKLPVVPFEIAKSPEQIDRLPMLLRVQEGLVARAQQYIEELSVQAASLTEIEQAITALNEQFVELKGDVERCVDQILAANLRVFANKIARQQALDGMQAQDVTNARTKLEEGLRLLQQHQEFTQQITAWEERCGALVGNLGGIRSKARGIATKIVRLREYLFDENPQDMLGTELGTVVESSSPDAVICTASDRLEQEIGTLSDDFQMVSNKHILVCYQKDRSRNRTYSVDDILGEITRALALVAQYQSALPGQSDPPTPPSGASEGVPVRPEQNAASIAVNGVIASKVAQLSGVQEQGISPPTSEGPSIGSSAAVDGEHYVVSTLPVVTVRYGQGRGRKESPLNELQHRLLIIIACDRVGPKNYMSKGMDPGSICEYWQEFFGAPVPSREQIHEALDELSFHYKDDEFLEKPPSRKERNEVSRGALLVRFRKKKGSRGTRQYVPNENTFAAIDAFPDALKMEDLAKKVMELRRQKSLLFSQQMEARRQLLAWAQTGDVRLLESEEALRQAMDTQIASALGEFNSSENVNTVCKFCWSKVVGILRKRSGISDQEQ